MSAALKFKPDEIEEFDPFLADLIRSAEREDTLFGPVTASLVNGYWESVISRRIESINDVPFVVINSIIRVNMMALLYYINEIGDSEEALALSGTLHSVGLHLSEFQTQFGRQAAMLSLMKKINEWIHVDALPPPEIAPILFEDRNRKEQKPSEFLEEVYGDWIESGSIYQYHLSRIDPKLLQGLNNEFRGRRDMLKTILPPKKKETDQLLSNAGISPRRSSERTRAAAVLRRAKPT